LPERGPCQSEGRGPGACQEWRLLGRRGLNVCDWKHWSGPYERLIIPENPIHSSSIGANLLSMLTPVLLNGLLFGHCKSFYSSELSVEM
jgi:hypothetical protein